MSKTWAIGAAVGAVVLTGCSGQGASSAPTPAVSVTPATAAPTPASTPAATPSAVAPSSSAASSARASATPVPRKTVVDPCSLISVAQMSKLTGIKLQSATPKTQSNTKLCTYAPASPAQGLAVSTQEGAYTGSLGTLVDALQSQLAGGTRTSAAVPGAETATVLTGTASSANFIDVIAGANGVYVQALVGGRVDVDQYHDAVVKAAGILLAG